MRKRRFDTSPDQLTLFDLGLDASATVKSPKSLQKRNVQAEIVRPLSDDAFSNRRILEFARDEPSPFEKASYDLYQKLRRETAWLARTTFLFEILLVAVVFFGIQIQEIGFGAFKVNSVNRQVLVGVIGWSTLLAAGLTLLRAFHSEQKRRQSGLFYQRVLIFSSNPIVRLATRFLNGLFVSILIAFIALTWILAQEEMLNLISYIFQKLTLLNNPWKTTVHPPR